MTEYLIAYRSKLGMNWATTYTANSMEEALALAEADPDVVEIQRIDDCVVGYER